MNFASRGGRLLLFTALAISFAAPGAGCRRSGWSRAAAPAGALATIAGRVVGASGSPFAGGQVSLILEEDDDPELAGEAAPRRLPMATEHPAADGTFRIANVPPGRYRLRARAAGQAETRVRLQARSGERIDALLRLTRAEALSGRVVDRRAAPIPAARVMVWSLANPTDRPKEALSDAAGNFVVGELSPGMHRLLIEAPGFGSLEENPVELPSPSRVLRMDADGKSVGGIVTSAGRPVGGARVLIGGENLNPGREVLSGGDGGFVIEGLGPGVYLLRASRQDQVSATSPEVVVDPSSQRPPAVHLELVAGFMVSGRVVDDSGHPSPGSEVRIDALPGDDPLPAIVLAGDDGSFHAGPLRIGEYRLTPRRPGFVARRPLRLLVGPRAPSSSGAQLLELVRGARISGRVTDQRHAPLRDVVVRCVMPGREDLAVIGDRLPLAAEAAALPSGSGHALGAGRSTLTDRDGRFELPDMLPGRFFLEASREGSVPRGAGPFLLRPGQRLDAGILTLSDGVRVTGRVIDDSGAPIEGARIGVRHAAPARSPAHADRTADTGAAEIAVLATDAGGQFSAALGEGESVLAVSAPGMINASLSVTAAAAAPPPPLTVHLVRAASRFDGVVSDAADRPVARAQVVAWPPPATPPGPGELPATPDGSAPLGSALTDAGGHFQLARLPRGPLLLEVKHPDYPRTLELVTAADALTPGVPVTIRLALPGGIEGEVREAISGAIISTYRVEARGPQGRAASATRKGRSGFGLSRLFPGSWTLSVRAPGYAAGEKQVEVPPGHAAAEPSVREVRIELEREPHR